MNVIHQGMPDTIQILCADDKTMRTMKIVVIEFRAYDRNSQFKTFFFFLRVMPSVGTVALQPAFFDVM